MEIAEEQSLAFLTYSEAVRTVDLETRGVGLNVLLREGNNLDGG